jgi:nucleolin
MAKTKSEKATKAAKPSKAEQVKAMNSVKGGAITKPSQTPKAKSQEVAKQVAKQVAVKVEKASKKSKKVKEPTPVPSSDEDDEDNEDMDSGSGSSDDSDSEKEAKPVSKTNGVVINGKANGKANGNAINSTKADLDSSDSSESSDDDEVAAPKATKAAPKATPKAIAAKEDSGSESEDDGDDSDDSDDNAASDSESEPKVKGPVDAKALNGALKKVASEEVRCHKNLLQVQITKDIDRFRLKRSLIAMGRPVTTPKALLTPTLRRMRRRITRVSLRSARQKLTLPPFRKRRRLNRCLKMVESKTSSLEACHGTSTRNG